MTEATTAVKKSKKSKADKAEKAEKPKAEKAEKSVKTKETKETKDTTKEETQATPTTEPSKQVPVSVSVESAKVEKKKKKEKKAVSIEEFVDAPEHPIVESVVVPVPVPAPVLPEPEPVPEPTPAKKEKKKKEKDTAEKAEKLPKKKVAEKASTSTSTASASPSPAATAAPSPKTTSVPQYPFNSADPVPSVATTTSLDEDNTPLAKLVTPPVSPLDAVPPSPSSATNGVTTASGSEKPKKKKRVFIMEQGSDDEDSDESGEVIVVRKVVKKETHSKKGKRVNSDSESDSSDITSDSSYDSDDSDEDDDEKPVTRTPVVDSKPSIFSSFRARFGTAATGGATATTSIEPSPASPAGVPTTVPLPQTDSDSEDEYTDDTEDEVDPTSATSTTSKASFFGSFTSALSSIPMPAALTSILEPEQTPEVRAREKQRKAQEVAIQRQMANNAKFAALNAVTGAIVDTSAPEVITSLRPSAPRTAATTRVPGMPIAPAPDSEREFTTGLNHYNNSNYPLAIVHFERAIKIDDNAESLRMLIEIHGPARVPNAAKVAEYSARRKAVLATPQGMLNHGRHLARITGSLDGPGIVLVRSAADDGNVEAMFEFGMYLRGKGKGGEAMGWLHKAAEGGWVDAEEAVAEGYEKGLGVPEDAVAGAAWRARVVARLKVAEREQAVADAEAAALAEELRKEAKKRTKEREKMEKQIKKREETLARRRAEDPALNSALRSLEWGFYASAIEQLANLAQLGNVDAKEFLDPDLSVISPKAIVAMFHIGQYHSSLADPVSAVKWFRRSAESGYHEAQVTYAAYLIVGKGLDTCDPGQAMAWLMKAWENGNNKEAALALGEAFTKGVGVAPDPTKAVKWYTRAWEAGGYSEAAFAIGLANATGFTPGAVDPSAWSASHASDGRKNVNEVLNKRSEKSGGQDIPNNGNQQADGSPSTTAANLKQDATSIKSGSSSTRPDSPAIVDSKTQLNPPPPTNTLNSPLLKNFSAFKQDVGQAAMWYKKASDLGHSRACNNLGELYMTGRGVQRNDVTGFSMFRRAAMAGLAEAEYNMGRCCREGRGCNRNEEQAIMWFKRAEAQGIKEATKALAQGAPE